LAVFVTEFTSDKLAVFVTEFTSEKLAVFVTEFTSEKLAVFVTEFTSEKLAVFVGRLTTAAIGGEQQTVDLLCTDVLTMTNHMSETAVSVALALQDTPRQRWAHTTGLDSHVTLATHVTLNNTFRGGQTHGSSNLYILRLIISVFSDTYKIIIFCAVFFLKELSVVSKNSICLDNTFLDSYNNSFIMCIFRQWKVK